MFCIKLNLITADVIKNILGWINLKGTKITEEKKMNAQMPAFLGFNKTITEICAIWSGSET